MSERGFTENQKDYGQGPAALGVVMRIVMSILAWLLFAPTKPIYAQDIAVDAAISNWLSRTYAQAVIMRKEHDAIVVRHATGIATIPLASIPPNLQLASQDIIFTPLASPLVISLSNAAPLLQEQLLTSANETFNMIEGDVRPISLYHAFKGRIVETPSNYLHLIDDGSVIKTLADHGLGSQISGLARPAGSYTKASRIKRYRSSVIPFRYNVSQSDDNGNCYLAGMSIYLVRPPPFNQEVIDGTEISGYAVDEGMHKYVSVLGAVNRIKKWRLLTPQELEEHTEWVSEEKTYARYDEVSHRAITMDELLGYVSANTAVEFMATLRHPCPTCEGKGYVSSPYEYEKAESACTYCSGRGRVAIKRSNSDQRYDSQGRKLQSFGTLKSEREDEFVNCQQCDGSGRVTINRPRQVRCADCAGNKYVPIKRKVKVIY